MRPSKIPLLALAASTLLAGILLVGVAEPAAADYKCTYGWYNEDYTYSCTKTRSVRKCDWLPEPVPPFHSVWTCWYEDEEYTGTCTGTRRVYGCTGTRSHTHSYWCSIHTEYPYGSSRNVTGSSNWRSSNHDGSETCAGLQVPVR